MEQRIETLEREVVLLKKQLLLMERAIKQHEMHLRKLNTQFRR